MPDPDVARQTPERTVRDADTLPRMSYDLYFWPTGAAPGRPHRLANRLAEERPGELVPDPRVLAFRAELLRRWPDLAHRLSPWHDDLVGQQPAGRTDLADRFAVLTLRYGWHDTELLPVLANLHGLDCYDPQTERLRRPDPAAPEDPADVRGQIAEDRVVELFRRLSGYVGYHYDELDEAALNGALDGTGFWYPLAGTPALTVHLTSAPDGTSVNVRIEGADDPLLAGRMRHLLDILRPGEA